MCRREPDLHCFPVFSPVPGPGSLAYGAAVWRMTKAPIPLAAALRETSVIFGVLIGVLLLKERLSAARILAVLMVARGAAGIKLWG